MIIFNFRAALLLSQFWWFSNVREKSRNPRWRIPDGRFQMAGTQSWNYFKTYLVVGLKGNISGRTIHPLNTCCSSVTLGVMVGERMEIHLRLSPTIPPPPPPPHHPIVKDQHSKTLPLWNLYFHSPAVNTTSIVIQG